MGKAQPPALLRVEAVFGPMFAYPGDLITKQILQFGAHARPELAMLLSVIAAGDRVFDIGAHIGTFAVPIARKIGPEGRLLAVEAMSRTCRVLRKNLRLNGVRSRVEIANALIAPPGCRYAPVKKRRNSGGTQFVEAESGLEIPCMSLDALCRDYFDPRVVKIDIEGFEAFALAGSEQLPRNTPIVYAEISAAALARNGASIADLDLWFRGCGYELYRNVAPRNAPGDGFQISRMENLSEGGAFFDVLAIHNKDERRHWLSIGP